jgi:SAM-dependent methyltransferase
MDPSLLKNKKQKVARIVPLLKDGLEYIQDNGRLDFLPPTLKQEYGLVDTENVSDHGYDGFAQEMLNANPDGFFLDCGCGKRPEYLLNVVNFEIVNYDTTDVLGIGEQLPFKDNSFDGVFSLNVLEHVKDPFQCAKEIARVLKPGGKLYCVVPFMSPYHDYPDHYYNMTKSGLANLFSPYLAIDNQDVISSGLPIFTLTWVLNSWLAGLEGKTKEGFLEMKVKDLVGNPVSYFDQPFVKELSQEKNFELGSTTAIWASKPR